MRYNSIRPGKEWLDTNGKPIQAAHGDREHGFIGARLRKPRKIIAHFDMESGIFTGVFPVCLICIISQKAAFCAIPL